MKTTEESSYTGGNRVRKPWTAANLSLVLAGLGQIYCGDFRRGIWQMVTVCLVLVAAMVVLAVEMASVVTVLVLLGSAGLLVTLLSGWDAFRMARRTRADYRLKEYNRAGVYAALVLLFFPAAVGCAFMVRANLIHAFVIPGDSMSPTIGAGQHVLVRKDAYRKEDPERGDMVVFLNPTDRGQHWVKRVVGLPGDVIEFREGAMWVNGDVREGDFGTEEKEAFTVPEHSCYVLGDNVGNSKDSRDIGAIPMIAIVGKVVYVY